MVKAVEATDAGTIPPEAEITSPEWYEHVDPTQATVTVRGDVHARGNAYTCRVEVAPGSEPNNGSTTDIPAGRLQGRQLRLVRRLHPHERVQRRPCHPRPQRPQDHASPPTAGAFNGPEPSPGPPNFNGRPNTEPYGFVVRVVATTTLGSQTLSGQDRRNLYLHRDAELLPGFPKHLTSDGSSSPLLVDLDADNRNEVVYGTSDGYVHAQRRDGTELPGWPKRSDPAAAAHRPARVHQRRGGRGRLARRDPRVARRRPTSTATACRRSPWPT